MNILLRINFFFCIITFVAFSSDAHACNGSSNLNRFIATSDSYDSRILDAPSDIHQMFALKNLADSLLPIVRECHDSIYSSDIAKSYLAQSMNHFHELKREADRYFRLSGTSYAELASMIGNNSNIGNLSSLLQLLIADSELRSVQKSAFRNLTLAYQLHDKGINTLK